MIADTVVSDPVLSIVIPTFRRTDYLPPLFRALSGQVDQAGDAVEVLLVDNDPAGSAGSFPLPAYAKYVHEPSPGVANARNAGVRAARGRHIVFLDDDELPCPGWLASWIDCAGQGVEAAFGPVEAAFDETPPDLLRPALERVFSRHLPARDKADITAERAYLGSGNSMFARAALDRISPPFEAAFNGGGEDVWLLRQLVEDHGLRLFWCADARVMERVPASRCTRSFLRRRRYRDGQLRCIVEAGGSGAKAALRVAFWMAAGAAQVVLGGAGAVAMRFLAPSRSLRLELMAFGGAGKLLWWRG